MGGCAPLRRRGDLGSGFALSTRFGPFVLVLFAWQLTAPIATDLPFPWHVTPLIAADKFMFFGTVPDAWLQKHLHHPGVIEPWDAFAAWMYMLTSSRR